MRTTCLRVAALLVSIAWPAMLSAQTPQPDATGRVAALEARLAKLTEEQSSVEKQLAAEIEAVKALLIQRGYVVTPPTAGASSPSSSQATAEKTAPASAAITTMTLAAQTAAVAGTTTTITQKTDGTMTTVVKPAEKKEEEGGRLSFGGLSWGIGVAFSYDIGDVSRVADAKVINGVVRATRSENVRARFIGETHYFFTPQGSLFTLENTATEKNWGIGPFVAVQPGGDDIIGAVGAGLMVGFRRPGTGDSSFNIGIGVLYDIDVTLLGRGLVVDAPLPPGEELHFRTAGQKSLMVVSSVHF